MRDLYHFLVEYWRVEFAIMVIAGIYWILIVSFKSDSPIRSTLLWPVLKISAILALVIFAILYVCLLLIAGWKIIHI